MELGVIGGGEWEIFYFLSKKNCIFRNIVHIGMLHSYQVQLCFFESGTHRIFLFCCQCNFKNI